MDANPVRCVVTFAVPPAGVQEVRAAVADLAAAAGSVPVRAVDPEFDDGVLTLTMEFGGPDELDASLPALGPVLGRIASVAPRRDLHVLGELPDEARAAIDRFGPTYHAFPG